MYRYSRFGLLLALLAAMLLSSALSGCSGSLTFSKQFGTQPTPDEAQLTPIAPAATATTAPTATKTPTKTQPAPTATPTKPAPTKTPEGAQTITQEIVIRNSYDQGGITAETTFTMTAQIQVGVVDGINLTSESVPMPKGAAPYDVADLPSIGDVVQGEDGLVVQVHGWETVDVDDEYQFVLVDVTIGNAGEERQLVATNPCMEIVSGDGHWYSATWYSLYWMNIGGLEHTEAMAKEMHDKLLENDITTDYSVALDPGQAARGTAVFPVPKSAKQLAFGFQSYLASTYLFFSNEANPTIFVPLGLEGDFTTIPEDVEDLEPGATYQVGESFVAPERGVAFQVQSAWARHQSLGQMYPLEPDEQFVFVHVIAPAGDDVTPLDQTRELALVDDNGDPFELLEWATDWLSVRLGQRNQRGVLMFRGPRDATGLQLQFNPLDPATMDDDSPEPLADEAVVVELGEIPVLPEVAILKTGDGPSEPPDGRKPTTTPASNGYELGDEVVVGDLAITVNGWSMDSGPESHQADPGSSWVIAYVAIENVGKAAVSVDPESFEFVDQDGRVYNDLLDRDSAWAKIADDLLEYTELQPGDRLMDQAIAVVIEDEATPGLRLRFTSGDEEPVEWDLDM